MKGLVNARSVAVALVAAALLLQPLIALATGNGFLLVISTRIVIMAVAASSLTLILGYGGMVSFGHAAYLGIGGYAVGILAHSGIYSGFIQWPAALLASAAFALVVGVLCLRTRGVYFIMITLAFAQMAYYVATGLDEFGGDDGLTIYRRSQFGGALDLSNKVAFYYLCLALLAATVFIVWRLANARFGLVLQGARSNDRRMQALGFPTYRYRVVAFVIAGTLCGLSGALLANHTDFVSPGILYWTRSGDLIIMVVLGGMATAVGPLFGAVALLVLEEALPAAIRLLGTPFVGEAAARASEYWQIVMGPLLLLVVLFARGGIMGLFAKLGAKERT